MSSGSLAGDRMALPDFSLLPDFAPLPDVPPGPDMVAAIIVEDEAILFVRKSGHKGSYYVLPSGYVAEGESLEAGCLRCAAAEVAEAAKEWSRQLQIDLRVERMVLSVGPKVHEHPWNRPGQKCHYFLVTGNRESILCGPQSQPKAAPGAMVWQPYDWISFAELRMKKIFPDTIAACELITKKGRERKPV
jgi:ADP-ribose pyrophosphatase YjhB (NUDIX family)